MRAGELDRRVNIQQYTETRNAKGEAIKTWSLLETVWAKVEPVAGSEPFQAEQENAKRTLKFTIRHRTDVTEKMRIAYGSFYYNIKSIEELERREGLAITAEAFVP